MISKMIPTWSRQCARILDRIRHAIGRKSMPAPSSDVGMRLQPLLRRWNTERVKLLPPELPANVEAVFERLGSKATRDVVELFSLLGGMDKMDDGYLKLWSLQEMESENTVRSEFGPIFADYLISSWCFRLRPIDEATSAVYVDHFDPRPPELVASSLTEFLTIYERDPEAAHA